MPTAIDSPFDLPRLLERMHRRYLDVVRLQLEAVQAADISPVQFMMLLNIQAGGTDISVRDLIERGFYLGSNASYNLKNLVDCGYVARTADARDKRAARLKLTDKGQNLFIAMRDKTQKIHAPLLAAKDGAQKHETTAHYLKALERSWSDAIAEGTPADSPTAKSVTDFLSV